MSEVRQRFSIIPAMAVTDQRLEPRDLQVLCLLGRHTDDLGWCTRSQVKMAQELNCGRATVQRSIGRLVEAGYVEHRTKQRASGADAAHDYRVVIDPPEPAAPTVQNDAEGVPTSGQGCPPMDGQGVPTHERAPMLTTPVKRSEREARESEQEGKQPEDPKAVERAFWRVVKDWPGFAGMPKEPAKAAWFALEADERAEAERKMPAWLQLLRAQRKSHVPAPSTYFREKLWRDVPEPEEEKPAALEAKPFGPLWMVARLKQLVNGPTISLPGLTHFQRHMVENGQADEAEIRREQQAKLGWPAINRMHDLATSRKGVMVAPALERLAELMEAVPVGSSTYEEWRHAHERQGWPWIPDPGGQRVVYFPRGGPAGLKAFEAALRGDDEHAVKAAE